MLLASVRRRWLAARAMRGLTRVASVALLALAPVLAVDFLLAPPDLVMVVLAVVAAGASAGTLAYTISASASGPLVIHIFEPFST